MKTHLTKEERDDRIKAIAKAFDKCAFRAQDLKAAAEAISKAFKKQQCQWHKRLPRKIKKQAKKTSLYFRNFTLKVSEPKTTEE